MDIWQLLAHAAYRFFFNDTATTEIYTYLHTLSLHDALPIFCPNQSFGRVPTHLALQSLLRPIEDINSQYKFVRKNAAHYVCAPDISIASRNFHIGQALCDPFHAHAVARKPGENVANYLCLLVRTSDINDALAVQSFRFAAL